MCLRCTWNLCVDKAACVWDVSYVVCKRKYRKYPMCVLLYDSKAMGFFCGRRTGGRDAVPGSCRVGGEVIGVLGL